MENKAIVNLINSKTRMKSKKIKDIANEKVGTDLQLVGSVPVENSSLCKG